MHDLAVVPIFVNAGAAVLPALMAGLVSTVGLICKPRELLALFRRRPLVPVALASLLGLGGLGIHWISVASAERPRRVSSQPAIPAWNEVATRILTARKKMAPHRAGAITSDLMLGRDAARCSYDGGSIPLGLTAAWSHREPDTFFLSTPAVYGDRVYGASCQIDIVDKFGYVFAADARTGKVIWKKPSASADAPPFKAFFSSPAITQDGKKLIIGQGLHDHADCSLLCFDTATGDLLWQVQTPLHLESSPAIRGDVVVIGAGAIEDKNHKPVGDPGYVLGVSISTGKELWRFAVADPESSPAIDEAGIVYIGAGINGNAIVALRTQSAQALEAEKLPRQVWKTPAPFPITGDVTIAGDLIVVGGGNSDYVNTDPRPAGVVMALDRKTGQVRWQKDMGDAVLGFIAFREGVLVCPLRSGHVALLDAATGNLRWRVKVGGGTPVLAGCAFTGTHIYTVTKTGWLYVMNAKDGSYAEDAILLNDPAKPGENGFSLSAPTISAGRLFVGSETGGLRCFDGTK